MHTPLTNIPDMVSVDVGDLDKVPDVKGENHDEVLAAYATGAGPSYPIQLAVLNYTNAQGNGSNPTWVTQVTAPYQATAAYASTISDVISVAIGDFDGDGQNEIALATLGPNGSGQVNLTIFRYTNPGNGQTPTLMPVTNQTFTLKVGGATADFLPTISLVAGDFAGSGHGAQLMLALENRSSNNSGGATIQNVLQAISVDSTLNAATEGATVENIYGVGQLSGLTAGKIIGLAGLFKFDPSNGFDLYRREIALVNNEQSPVSNDSNAKLDIKLYQVADDLSSITPMFNGQMLQLPDNGVGAKFSATAGGLAVEGNFQTPLWTLATEQIISGEFENVVTTIKLGTALAATPPESFGSNCCHGGNVATDNAYRPTVVAYDYRGRSAFFGAPVISTVNDLINTDFVLEEPPKHAYWDEAAQQLVVVSRFPTTAVNLVNKQGTSFTGKSTDNTNWTIGGSAAITAKGSAETKLGLVSTKTSVEGTLKVSYNYKKNEAPYNSNYASRTLSETESTDNDDFISGRAQLINIWRYRALGVPGQDGLNPYYDVVFPGQVINFKASGLDLDWYQPLHENGNILSYQGPANSTFSPADVGTYGIPCPAGAGDCTNGIKTVSGEMIPATQAFISNTSGTLGFDYNNNTGSGNTVTYEHKLAESADVKIGYAAEVKAGAIKGGTSVDVALNLSNENSWGNTTTSQSATTSNTGITISRSAISPTQAYAFYPTAYTTADGTIKVAHAADPPGSASGRGFWSTVYGSAPDPALNLPLRFARNGTSWSPNTLISRKRMRGFFVLSPDIDPVTREYDILGLAPTDGQKVRLSAQVYNYSTGQGFSNCQVQFYAIKYDSVRNVETGPRRLIGTTSISLQPRAMAPAQIIWDTTGFGPASNGGGQDYRIYVDLNYNKAIDEIYPPEDPNKLYAPGLPLGLDPGQNDEGWGLATVMSPSSARASSFLQPVTLAFGSTPLAIVSSSGDLLTQSLSARAGTPVELRADICASASSAEPADVLVFDGDPSNANLIAWKRLYVANPKKCEGTWFSWTPSRGQHNLVAMILPNSPTAFEANDATLSSPPPLREAGLAVYVP